MRLPLVAVFCASISFGVSHADAAEPLVIHEWGTFTSLQDEQGRTIGGINTDEEKLPEFVHDLHPVPMGKDGDFSPKLIKGRDYCDPAVTMRLETPVIYVHLPPGQEHATFDLNVEFRGGILSQFYPAAVASVDGRFVRKINGKVMVGESKPNSTTWEPPQPHYTSVWSAPELSATTTSSLTWYGMVVGGSGQVPATTSPVWLAPRQVKAPTLTVGDEREKYLFYRGLGHLDAPLIAKRSADGATLTVSPRATVETSGWTTNYLPRLWLADVRSDGTAAFRTVKGMNLFPMGKLTPIATQTFPATFVDADFSAERLRLLKQELHAELMQEGLFADEAQALLSTWEASYFKSPGQRLFFLVPKRWTDQVLPLTTSVPATVIRAMMGRIELVSPTQRQALQRIADGPVSDDKWFKQLGYDHLHHVVGENLVFRPGGQELNKRIYLDNERGLLAKLNVTPPADYQAYLSLGRFRDALLWDAQIHAPDPERAQFLRTYLLTWGPYGWRLDALNGKPAAQASPR